MHILACLSQLYTRWTHLTSGENADSDKDAESAPACATPVANRDVASAHSDKPPRKRVRTPPATPNRTPWSTGTNGFPVSLPSHSVGPYQVYSEYLAAGRPLILTGVSDNWRATREWVTAHGEPRVDELARLFGESLVAVLPAEKRRRPPGGEHEDGAAPSGGKRAHRNAPAALLGQSSGVIPGDLAWAAPERMRLAEFAEWWVARKVPPRADVARSPFHGGSEEMQKADAASRDIAAVDVNGGAPDDNVPLLEVSGWGFLDEHPGYAAYEVPPQLEDDWLSEPGAVGCKCGGYMADGTGDGIARVVKHEQSNDIASTAYVKMEGDWPATKVTVSGGQEISPATDAIGALLSVAEQQPPLLDTETVASGEDVASEGGSTAVVPSDSLDYRDGYAVGNEGAGRGGTLAPPMGCGEDETWPLRSVCISPKGMVTPLRTAAAWCALWCVNLCGVSKWTIVPSKVRGWLRCKRPASLFVYTLPVRSPFTRPNALCANSMRSS